jgi:hypothetical protein
MLGIPTRMMQYFGEWHHTRDTLYIYLYTVKSLLFVGYQFSGFSWVGWSTKLRIHQTMKLGKQFDINILAVAVLKWPRLSGSAAYGTIDNFNDKISTSIPFLMGIHVNMFVNYLILNACVKMTEMFACEKILTTSGYGNQIYFQTIHWRRHTSKCCINISLLKYNTLVSINIFSGVVEILKCSTCPRASYLKKVTCTDKILLVLGFF